MSEQIVKLADCSEIRQKLLAKPPRVISLTASLLIALTVVAFCWAAWTNAEIVVRANGRVRPVDAVTRVFTPSGLDFDGRVQKVDFQEGGLVTKGQTLLQLDTARLDIRIDEETTRIDSAKREIDTLQRRKQLLQSQQTAAHSRAEIELLEAEQRLEQLRSDRDSRIRHCEAELTRAKDNYRRSESLESSNVISRQELTTSHADVTKAQRELDQALLPIDDGQANVLRATRDAIEKDFAVRTAELEHAQVAKQGEIEVAQKVLAKLQYGRSCQELKSPIDGVIISSRINQGDVLQPGTAIIEIAPRESILFEANVPSEQVGNLREGMEVKLKLDAFDYQQYGTLPGKICFIAPDSHLSGDNRASPIAMYKVRVELLQTSVGRNGRQASIKLGMGAMAEFVTERHTLLEIMLKKLRGSISLG